MAKPTYDQLFKIAAAAVRVRNSLWYMAHIPATDWMQLHNAIAESDIEETLGLEADNDEFDNEPVKPTAKLYKEIFQTPE